MKQFDLNNNILETKKYMYNLYKTNIPYYNITNIEKKYPKICNKFNYLNVYPYLNILEKISHYQLKSFKFFLFKYFNKSLNLQFNLTDNIDDIIISLDYLVILIFSIQYFFI